MHLIYIIDRIHQLLNNLKKEFLLIFEVEGSVI
jgi:uncharacterized protein YkuJ